jgi:hypothetical protein
LIAACLLGASILVPPIGVISSMNGLYWGLGERYFLPVWVALQFAVTPVGNVVSLILADRRRAWVKLNYFILVLWLLLTALIWFVSRVLVITK